MANIYIKTFGCALNQSDSELMAGVLKKEGHVIVSEENKAEVVIINSCTVKNEAEVKFYREINRHKTKKIILAGCIPQAEKKLTETKLKDYSIIGTSQISKINLVVEQTLDGNRIILLDTPKNQRLNLPKIRKNKIIEIIPISEGCLGACTYCKTRQARGELVSYKKEDIVKQLKSALKEGVKEIYITSQDTGAYGKDIKSSLPELLYELIKIEGDFKIRLGMCNPNFALDYLNELKVILNHEKMFRFIHFPVQSGADNILKIMGRKYSRQDFEKVVKELKKSVSNLTIATDIIIGFPGETDNDFNETMRLIKLIRPDILNMSRFWPRAGTVASEMKQIDVKVMKERSIKLKKLFEKIAYENNQKWIGWSGDAIIDDVGKNDMLIARNFAYKLILIKNKGQKIGDNIDVKITSASTWDLRN